MNLGYPSNQNRKEEFEMKTRAFEDFLERKTEAVYSAAYDLASALVARNGTETEESIPWDMSFIGEIADAAESVLESNGIRHCNPYYEGKDEIPCYLGSDCTYVDCPLRTENQKCKER